MTRRTLAMALFVALAAAAPVARADGRAAPAGCARAQGVRARFSARAGTPLGDFVAWASAASCVEIRFPQGLAGRSLPRALRTGPLSPARARRLIRKTLGQMGLELVQREGFLEVVARGATPAPATGAASASAPAAGAAASGAAVSGAASGTTPGAVAPGTTPASGAAPGTAPALAPTPAPPVDRAAVVAAVLDRGVRRLDDRHFELVRAELASIHEGEYLASARVVPILGTGLKVFGIRPGSIAARLGLQSGDVVRTVNGSDLSSPDKALEAYERFRSADHLSVGITRRGQPLTLEYTIR